MNKTKRLPVVTKYFKDKVIISKNATVDSPGKWTFTIILPPGCEVDKTVFDFVSNRLATLDDLAAMMVAKS